MRRFGQLGEAGPAARLTTWDGPLNYEGDQFPPFPTAECFKDLIQRFSTAGDPAGGLPPSRRYTSIELSGDIRCVNEEIPNDPDNAAMRCNHPGMVRAWSDGIEVVSALDCVIVYAVTPLDFEAENRPVTGDNLFLALRVVVKLSPFLAEVRKSRAFPSLFL